MEATNKENLLKSNKETLSIDGFNSLNMRKLALKNNIGLHTIYNYFKKRRTINYYFCFYI